MPNNVQIKLTVREDGAAAIDRVSKNVRDLERTTKVAASSAAASFQTLRQNWIGFTAAATAAAIALKKAFDITRESAQFEEDIGRLNRQLAQFDTNAAKLIPSMTRLSAGQLSLAESAQLASRGLASGLDPRQIEKFTLLADVAGDVLGQSLPQAFDTLTRAAATGRGAVLKQLGIFIDLELETQKLAEATGRTTTEVGEQERAMIGLRKITEQANAVIKKFGAAEASTADELTALTKRTDDLQIALGFGLQGTVLGIVGTLKLMGAGAVRVAEQFLRASKTLRELVGAEVSNELLFDIAELDARAQALTEGGLKDLTTANAALEAAMDPVAAITARQSDELDRSATRMGETSAAADDLIRQQRELGEEQERLGEQIVRETLLLLQATHALQQQETAIKRLQQSVKPATESIQALIQSEKDLIRQERDLKEQRESLLEQAEVTVRRLFPTEIPEFDKDKVVVPVQQQAQQLEDVFLGLVEEASQSSGLMREEILREAQALLPQLRDVFSEFLPVDVVQEQITELVGELTQLRVDVVDQQQQAIQAQREAVLDNLSILQDFARGVQSDMAQLFDAVSAQAQTATGTIQDQFLRLLQTIRQASQDITAQASLPLPAPVLGHGGSVEGSFATGTPFVPRDMIAQIHRGEAVIPAQQNPFARGGQPVSFSGGNATIHFSVNVQGAGFPSDQAGIRRLVRDRILPELQLVM